MKNNKKEIQDELEKLAPSLSKLKKEESFEVPENYFSQLPDQILGEINLSKNNTQVELVSSSISWFDQIAERLTIFFQPKMAVRFAMMIALVATVYFMNNNTNTEVPQVAELTSTELEDYVKANLDDFETEELLNILSEGETETWTEMDIDDEDLDEYLEEIIDDLDTDDLEDFL